MAVDLKKLMQKPYIKVDDMGDNSSEVVEILTSAVDKFLSTENYEKASQACKEALDKKFGPTWNVCIGEGFGYEVKYNARHMILVYYGEKIGILAFKV